MDELWHWYDHGGAEHVAAYLATRDISKFKPKAPPPKTPAFYAIANAGRPPEFAELLDVLDELGNPDAVTLQQIKDQANGEFRIWANERKNRWAFPHRLEACGYIEVNNPDAPLWRIKGKRQAIYANKTLSLAEQIKAAQELTK